MQSYNANECSRSLNAKNARITITLSLPKRSIAEDKKVQ